LSVARSTDELRSEYIRASDSLRAFIDDKCEEALYEPADYACVSREKLPAQGFISKRDFYTKYKEYCAANKLNCFSNARVGKMIMNYGMAIEKGKDEINDERHESYRGIQWRLEN